MSLLPGKTSCSACDDEGIDLAVMLPVYNASPEGAPPWIALLDDRMSVRDQVLDANRYPGRIIPFGNLDPRWGANSAANDSGLCWSGSLPTTVKVWGSDSPSAFDDPRVVNMFRQLGAYRLLVTIEARACRRAATACRMNQARRGSNGF